MRLKVQTRSGCSVTGREKETPKKPQTQFALYSNFALRDGAFRCLLCRDFSKLGGVEQTLRIRRPRIGAPGNLLWLLQRTGPPTVRASRRRREFISVRRVPENPGVLSAAPVLRLLSSSPISPPIFPFQFPAAPQDDGDRAPREGSGR